MSGQSYSAGELILRLEQYNGFKEAFLKTYPKFHTNQWLTVEEHAIRTVSLFDNYRYFSDIEFPDSLIRREKFRVILALHDTGMADIHKEADIGKKFGFSMDNIQWIMCQTDFRDNFAFNSQEERIGLALVSGDPLWRYLANTRDAIATAETIGQMAYRAGIETDSSDFYSLYLHIVVYFICDAGSYTKTAGGASPDGHFAFEHTKKRINFTYAAKKQMDKLNEIIVRMSMGAVPFTDHIWKPIKYKYLTEYARRSRLQLRKGEQLSGEAVKYRFNVHTGYNEIQPYKIPFLYDPTY